MDEPTASLSAHEARRLFRIVESLRQSGVAILFISHRMEEVFEIADRVTVLRDGRWISTARRGELARRRRDPGHGRARRRQTSSSADATNPGPVVLEVRDLGRDGRLRRDLVRGPGRRGPRVRRPRRRAPDRRRAGPVRHRAGRQRRDRDRRSAGHGSAARTKRCGTGIAYTTEDRHGLGLVLPLSIAANISLPSLSRYLDRAGIAPAAGEEAATAPRVPRPAEHPRPRRSRARQRRCRAATSRRSC